jgi:tRNA-dihydrouridine synthase B
MLKPIPNMPASINFPFCLAPMVGLSHVVFRSLLRDYLPEEAVTLWPSEMLNSRKLPHEIFEQVPETQKSDDESFWVPQILGNDEESIGASVRRLADWGAEGIDINMGCPVKKALRHNYGVALMGDQEYAADVVRMTVRHSSLPVSVKLRAGETGELPSLIQFVQKLERAGASWLTFHPRTAEQKRRGKADWSQIKVLRENLNIPLIGNGDIQTADDAFAMMDQTDVPIVMIGRALTARPWMLWQIGSRLGLKNPKGRMGSAPSTPEEEANEYGVFLQKMWFMMSERWAFPYANRKFQFFIRMSSVWLDFGHTLYADVTKAKDKTEVATALEKFFSQPHRMCQRTELRM